MKWGVGVCWGGEKVVKWGVCWGGEEEVVKWGVCWGGEEEVVRIAAEPVRRGGVGWGGGVAERVQR